MLKYLYIFIFSVALVSGGKVFGGRHAKQGEFPFVVAIFSEVECSGALVSMVKVVTAGHCLKYKINGQIKDINITDSWVSAGSTDLENDHPDYAERGIESVLLAEGFEIASRWNGKLNSHDIGLVFVEHPFILGRNVQPMKIFSGDKAVLKKSWDDIVTKGTVCYTTAWGESTLNTTIDSGFSTQTSILKVIAVRPLLNRICQSLFKPVDDITKYGEVCVDSVNITEIVCGGDSGGPLVCNGFSYAIHSHGPKCGSTYYPKIFIQFLNYIDFLSLTDDSLSLSPTWYLLLILFPILSKYIFK